MYRATHNRHLVVSTIVAWGLACTACSGSEIASAVCSHDSDCPTGGKCANGVCKKLCDTDTDTDCGPTSGLAEGATRNVSEDGVCATGSCSEADADNDGFEETIDCDDNDATIFPGAQDLPDPDSIDADCDGIDGSIDAAVFVSTEGDDANPGTVTAPVRSIQHAVDLAAADALRWQVLVAAGTYEEAVIVPDGVSLFGGYASSGWERGDDNETTIDAPSLLAVYVRDTTVVGYVEGFTVRSRDADVGEGSSIAVGLRGLQQSFYVRYNRLEAGRGGDGPAGSSGARGASGGDGGPGIGLFTPGSGGAAGGSDAGSGGHGASGAGAPGSGGPGGAGGAVGGGNGASGGSAPPASHGALPADQALGTRGDMDWVALSGGAGARGAGGGGGGGGGTGACFCLPYLCPTAGGGGGGGGVGSAGGLGGNGGGGSFGVFAVDAGLAIIMENTIVTAGGGTGGAGGDGGRGGVGGAGGRGTLCWGQEIGSGGEGGGGGNGGHGGGGAGGAGGMSVAIFQSASPGLTLGRNASELGAAGAGGLGGYNGSSRAATGEDGVRAEHVVYD